MLLTLSLPTEEIFLMHSENRPVAKLPAVDFRFQPREMPLVKQQDTQLPVFHFIYWFSSPYRKVWTSLSVSDTDFSVRHSLMLLWFADLMNVTEEVTIHRPRHRRKEANRHRHDLKERRRSYYARPPTKALVATPISGDNFRIIPPQKGRLLVII